MPNETHPLKAWRKRRRLSLRKLAGAINALGGPSVTHTTLNRVELGAREPRLGLIVAIYKISGGEVTPNDWLPADAKPARRC